MLGKIIISVAGKARLDSRSKMALALLFFSQTAWQANSFAGADTYVQGNLTYDLSAVRSPALRSMILGALQLGYQQAAQGKPHIQKVINDLGSTGSRVIRFSSDPTQSGIVEVNGGGFCSWTGPYGPEDYASPISQRTNITVTIPVFSGDNPDYAITVNTVWHELLHATLNYTHSYPGADPRYVNTPLWVNTLVNIMYDFPRQAVNPVNGAQVELYDPESFPWS